MKRRVDVDVLVAVLVLAAFLAIAWTHDDPHANAAATPAHAAAGELVQGKGVAWWSRHAVQARKDANARRTVIRRLRHARIVEFEPPYEHAARLAALAYHVDAATLIRKGRCESARWTRFLNSGSGAAGPWQFLGSTWASTPYAAYSPYDPFAAALAAAYMHSVGRGGEWVCR